MQERPARYDIHRPLSYRARTADGPVEGQGETINISRRGLLFYSDHEIEPGSKIELVVQMGDPAGDGQRIQFHVQGVTVRKQEGSIAVYIKRHKLGPADGSLGWTVASA